MDSERFLTFQIVSNKGRYYAFLFTIPQLVFWLGHHSVFLSVLITSVGGNTVCSVKKLQNYQDKGLSTLGQTRIVPIKSKDKLKKICKQKKQPVEKHGKQGHMQIETLH